MTIRSCPQCSIEHDSVTPASRDPFARRDLGTEAHACARCGCELLIERSGTVAAEGAPRGLWVGVFGYTEVPEHRTRGCYVRRVDGGLEVVCSLDCRER